MPASARKHAIRQLLQNLPEALEDLQHACAQNAATVGHEELYKSAAALLHALCNTQQQAWRQSSVARGGSATHSSESMAQENVSVVCGGQEGGLQSPQVGMGGDSAGAGGAPLPLDVSSAPVLSVGSLDTIARSRKLDYLSCLSLYLRVAPACGG
jgi:hypothetical protein